MQISVRSSLKSTHFLYANGPKPVIIILTTIIETDKICLKSPLWRRHGPTDHRRSDSSLLSADCMVAMRGEHSPPPPHSTSLPGPFHPFTHSPLYPLTQDGLAFGQVIVYLYIKFFLVWLNIRPDNPDFFEIRYPAGYRI
jgi:hypothetical protein